MDRETENDSKAEKVYYFNDKSNPCAINIETENSDNNEEAVQVKEESLKDCPLKICIEEEGIITESVDETLSSYQHRSLNLKNFINALLNRSQTKPQQVALNIAEFLSMNDGKLRNFVLNHCENHSRQDEIILEWMQMEIFLKIFKECLILETDTLTAEELVEEFNENLDLNFSIENKWILFLKSLISDAFIEEFAQKIREDSAVYFDMTKRKKLHFSVEDISKMFLLILLDAYSYTVSLNNEEQMKIFLIKMDKPHTYDHHVFYTVCRKNQELSSKLNDLDTLNRLKNKLLNNIIPKNEVMQLSLNPNLFWARVGLAFVLLSIFDFGFDMYTAYKFIASNNTYYGYMTIFIIVLAGSLNVFLERYISKNPFFNQKYILNILDKFPLKDILSFFQLTACLRSIKSYMSVTAGLKKTQLDSILDKMDDGEKASLHFSSTTIKYVETCIESVPQAVLQLHFILTRNTLDVSLFLKILMSLVFINASALNFLKLWNYCSIFDALRKFSLYSLSYFGFTILSHTFLFYLSPWPCSILMILINVVIAFGSRPSNMLGELDVSLKFFNINFKSIEYMYFINIVTFAENLIFIILVFFLLLNRFCFCSVHFLFFFVYVKTFAFWTEKFLSEDCYTLLDLNIMNLGWFLTHLWDE